MRPLLSVLSLLLICACTSAPVEPPGPVPTPALHTPRWAFRPWISKDISDGPDTRAFVKGFQDRDIPVGVVVLDSPWETNYNTFVPNPARYPDFKQLVADLKADDIRTELWVTSLVNRESLDLEPGGDTYPEPSPNFDEGLEKAYFVNEGATYFWWKGFGAALDFFNLDAAAWWHAQQDPLLDLGIAGWKLDFGEEYITDVPMKTAAGPKTRQEYSEEYYRDFLAWGVHRRGPEEFVTMVRPYDQSYGLEGRFFARREHAPVAWVGDNRRDWVGLSDALDHIFRSAAAGYVVVGSDIGGYLDRDDVELTKLVPFDTSVFLRWTALGALMPFMQLHGRANITPWSVPDRAEESVAAWRYWATLHEELVPFFYSLSEEAIAGASPIIRPVGELASWAGDYRYQLGEAFLVAPILSATGVRDVALPAGARWYDWWAPGSDALAGGTNLAAFDVADAKRVPLFVREGAIVPLEVKDDRTGLGSAASAGKLTVLVWPAATESRFVLHEEDGRRTTITAKGGTLSLDRARRPVLVGVRAEAKPAGVTVGGAAVEAHGTRVAFDAATAGWFDDRASRTTWVHVPVVTAAVSVALE